MDICQHKKTWAGFVKFIEWSLGGILPAHVLPDALPHAQLIPFNGYR